MLLIRIFIWAILVGELLFSLQAQTNTTTTDSSLKDIPDVLPVIQVSENKLARDIEQAVAPTEVMTRDQIEQAGVEDLQEALAMFPGVQADSHGNNQLMRFQGLDGKYMQILVDGVPMAGQIFGTLPLDQFSLGSIERIEFIRGASSGLYGNSAMGGVINLVTRKSDYYQALSFSHESRYGFNKKYHMNTALWQDLGPDYGGFGYSIRGQFSWDDGFYTNAKIGDINLPIYELPKRIDYQVTGRTHWKWGEKKDNLVELLGDFGQKFSESVGAINTEKQLVDDENARGGVNWKLNQIKNTKIFGFTTYKRFHRKSRTFSAITDKEREVDEQSFDDVEFENSFLINSFIGEWLIGVNYLLETAKADSISSDRKLRHTVATFIRDDLEFQDGRLLLSAGVRLLYNNLFGFNASPQLGLRWIVTDLFTWRLNYGRGYKSPTFKNNYFKWVHPAPANFLLVGNPDLKPETSDSITTSFHFKWTPFFKAEVLAYFHYIHDAISYGEEVAGTGLVGGRTYKGVRRAENLNQIWRTGFDVSLSGNSKYFFYRLAYSFLKGRNDNESNIAEFITPHNVKLLSGVRLPKIKTEIVLHGQWNAPQLLDASTGEKSKDLYDLNLNIRQPIGKYFTLLGGVKNILNIKTPEMDRQEGIDPYLGVRFYAPNLFSI